MSQAPNRGEGPVPNRGEGPVPRVVVVFASRTGRTRRMAEAVAEGARAAGARVLLREASEAAQDDLLTCDALILGSGVHMAGVEAPMRKFLSDTAPLWMGGKLQGRLGAAFASAGDGASGGAELTLLSMLATLAQHGMLLVPMAPKLEGFAAAGMHWGPVAQTQPKGGEPGPTEAQLVAARSHGQWVAECATRWLAGQSSTGSA